MTEMAKVVGNGDEHMIHGKRKLYSRLLDFSEFGCVHSGWQGFEFIFLVETLTYQPTRFCQRD